MNLHTQAQRGVEAKQVLENEAYRDAMASLKAQVYEQWKNCPVRDHEGQLLLLQLAKITEKFESILSGAVEAGKMAQHKIDLDELRNESKTRKFLRKIA